MYYHVIDVTSVYDWKSEHGSDLQCFDSVNEAMDVQFVGIVFRLQYFSIHIFQVWFFSFYDLN